MKKAIFLILGFLIVSCSDDPQKLLNQARTKTLGSNSVKYNQLMLTENPTGTFDTYKTSILFCKNEAHSDEYDYITIEGQEEYVGLHGDFKLINHAEKKVYLDDKDGLSKKYSPLTFLELDDWKFVCDTVVDGIQLRDYYNVENDTVIKGNKLYTERHIFINPDSKLVERFERRNYFKEKLSQIFIFKYLDYNLDSIKGKLTYDLPKDYKTVPKGASDTKITLNIGEEAPLFSSKDLNNKSFTLEELRGKKVLLMFSIIRCGYCEQALAHLNQKEYKLSDDITALYLNPFEAEKEVIQYASKVNIPFPVIPNAKAIGEAYGVEGFPTFFLINEQGKIEKISNYQKEFLDSLKQ